MIEDTKYGTEETALQDIFEILKCQIDGPETSFDPTKGSLCMYHQENVIK